ncbi:hypothetical protein PINS_up006679 [Pythium insidiosum]|nr:hypothetical protein PINS_up006679 [Pythium insidiosum]
MPSVLYTLQDTSVHQEDALRQLPLRKSPSWGSLSTASSSPVSSPLSSPTNAGMSSPLMTSSLLSYSIHDALQDEDAEFHIDDEDMETFRLPEVIVAPPPTRRSRARAHSTASVASTSSSPSTAVRSPLRTRTQSASTALTSWLTGSYETAPAAPESQPFHLPAATSDDDLVALAVIEDASTGPNDPSSPASCEGAGSSSSSSSPWSKRIRSWSWTHHRPTQQS